MALIRQDENGLFLRMAGLVFRPQRSEALAMWPLQEQVRFGDAPGRFHAGDHVPVASLSPAPLARVGNEVWFAHDTPQQPAVGRGLGALGRGMRAG